MKYEAGQSLAYALGRHLAQMLHKSGRKDCFDLVACTTKHWTKRLITGVNSPEVIMQGLAEWANLPAAADLLVCRRRISKQSMLSTSTVGSKTSTVPGSYPTIRSSGKHECCWWTTSSPTGATAHAIAKVLRQNGASAGECRGGGTGDQVARVLCGHLWRFMDHANVLAIISMSWGEHNTP